MLIVFKDYDDNIYESTIFQSSMKNKTLEFVKNCTISTAFFVAGGIAGAELSDLASDSSFAISAVSTSLEYIAGYSSFLGLHVHDNIEHYKKDGKWERKEITSDIKKALICFSIPDIAYLLSRHYVMKYFLDNDYDSAKSSMLADIVCAPIFFLAIPAAKRMGLIKKKK